MEHGPDPWINGICLTLLKLDAHLDEVIAGPEGPEMIGGERMGELAPFTGHRPISGIEMLLPDHHHVIGYLAPGSAVATLTPVCAPNRHTPLDFGTDQR